VYLGDYLDEKEVFGVFQNHWEMWEKLNLVLVHVVAGGSHFAG